MAGRRILLFDSGMGGLTVARAVRDRLEQDLLFYAADNAAFPYGGWDEAPLIKRIVMVMGRMIARVQPDVVVVACNTASTLAMIDLRRSYALPFVGTVPAIKPAAASTKSGIIGVLATPGTVKREYTHSLIHTYAYHCKVFLHGAPRLAEIAERKLKGLDVDLAALREEVMPVFRQRDGRRTDVVVLGCTHYPLLLDEIRDVAPWEVNYVDPAPAIARQTEFVLSESAIRHRGQYDLAPDSLLLLTGPKGLNDETLKAYAGMGFGKAEMLDLPVAAADRF